MDYYNKINEKLKKYSNPFIKKSPSRCQEGEKEVETHSLVVAKNVSVPESVVEEKISCESLVVELADSLAYRLQSHEFFRLHIGRTR